MDSPLKIGIVGYGKSAKLFHIPIISAVSGLTVSSIVQRSGSEAEKNHPECTIRRSIGEMLQMDELDLIVITTPNEVHFEQTENALRAGNHVVVEKPFTVDSKEAYRLAEIAKEENKVLSVYHNRRWDGDFLTVKKIIESGILGRLVEVESNFNRFRNYQREGAWKEKNVPGSGILYDLGPHLIDQSVELFGKPDSLFADIRKQRDGSVTDDYFQLTLGYGGLKVTLNAGMLVPESSPRFIVRGVNGSFIKYGMDPQEKSLIEGKTPADPNWAEEPEHLWGTLLLYEGGEIVEKSVKTKKGGYERYYQNVRDAILGNEELIVTPKQAASVIELIELAAESDRSQKVLSV